MFVSLKTKAVFFRQIATLVEASIPLIRAMDVLKKQTPNSTLKKVAEYLKNSFLKGEKMSDALSQFKIFDPLEISLIKAGEAGGTLDERLKNLANYLEEVYSLRLKIIGKLIYPFLILNAAIFIPPIVNAVTNGLAYYIKTVLINISILYGGSFLIYMIYRALKMVPEFNSLFSCIVLIVPLLGSMNYKLSLARYLYIFGELYEAGVDIYKSNELSANTCSNTAIKNKLLKAADYLKGGDTLSQALSKSKVVPGISISLIATGEESGKASSMYKKSSEYLFQEAEGDINKLMIVLPVLMFLLLTAYIGYIIISFYVGYFNKIFNI